MSGFQLPPLTISEQDNTIFVIIKQVRKLEEPFYAIVRVLLLGLQI